MQERDGKREGWYEVTGVRTSAPEIQRDRETERQRDRETERQRDRETERQRDRETQRHRDAETQRHRDTETDRACTSKTPSERKSSPCQSMSRTAASSESNAQSP